MIHKKLAAKSFLHDEFSFYDFFILTELDEYFPPNFDNPHNPSDLY